MKEKTPSKNFNEVFHEVTRLLGSLLMHYTIEDFREDLSKVFKGQIQKTCISKKNLWFQNIENEWKIK